MKRARLADVTCSQEVAVEKNDFRKVAEIVDEFQLIQEQPDVSGCDEASTPGSIDTVTGGGSPEEGLEKGGRDRR